MKSGDQYQQLKQPNQIGVSRLKLQRAQSPDAAQKFLHHRYDQNRGRSAGESCNGRTKCRSRPAQRRARRRRPYRAANHAYRSGSGAGRGWPRPATANDGRQQADCRLPKISSSATNSLADAQIAAPAIPAARNKAESCRKAFDMPHEGQRDDQQRQIPAPRPTVRPAKFSAGRGAREEADIVMWASAHAIEAHRTIHVAAHLRRE